MRAAERAGQSNTAGSGALSARNKAVNTPKGSMGALGQPSLTCVNNVKEQGRNRV